MNCLSFPHLSTFIAVPGTVLPLLGTVLTRSALFPLHAIPDTVLTGYSITGYRAHTQHAVPLTRYSRSCAYTLRCVSYTLVPLLSDTLPTGAPQRPPSDILIYPHTHTHTTPPHIITMVIGIL